MGVGVRALVWNFSGLSLDCLVTDGIVIVEEKRTNIVGVIVTQDQLCSKY